jgi:hypothetical protein
VEEAAERVVAIVAHFPQGSYENGAVAYGIILELGGLRKTIPWQCLAVPAFSPLAQDLLAQLATANIDVRRRRRFERDTQKRRAASRAKKLQALEAK